MAAPVGRSKTNEAARPAALTSVPTIQPIASCLDSDRRKHDADGGGNDQERKDQQHAGNRDRTGHHDAESRIEYEFPNERARLPSCDGAAANAAARSLHKAEQ